MQVQPSPYLCPSGGGSVSEAEAREKGETELEEEGAGYSTPCREEGAGYSTPCREPGAGYSTPCREPGAGYSTPCREPGAGYSTPCRGGYTPWSARGAPWSVLQGAPGGWRGSRERAARPAGEEWQLSAGAGGLPGGRPVGREVTSSGAIVI